MKVRFCCDNGANIHSKRTEDFDVEEDLNMTLEEWDQMPEEEKDKMVQEWAYERMDIWIEKLED